MGDHGQTRRSDARRRGGHRCPEASGTERLPGVFAEEEWRGLEQNPETSSRSAKLAREGKKVMQFLRQGRYVAVVADGQVFTYGPR